MALPNLSGSNIQDTFHRVLHTDGTEYFDGTGSVVPIVLEDTSPSFTNILLGANITHIGDPDTSINFGVDNIRFQAGGKLVYDVNSDGLDMSKPMTSSAEISSSSTISASAFVGDGSGLTGVTAEWDGTHTGTATFTGSITASGDISASGDIHGEEIYTNFLHPTSGSYTPGVDIPGSGTYGNVYPDSTGIDMSGPNQIFLKINAVPFIRLKYTTPYSSYVSVNDAKTYCDFKVKGLVDDDLIFADASANRVGIGIDSPTAKLDVGGNLRVTSNITASGAISASGTITATSFIGNMDGGTF